MADNLNDLRQWLITEIGRNQTYHNHKENMAWIATAFYIPAIITLGFKVAPIPTCWVLTVVTFFFVIVGSLVGFFLCFQFRNRWIAAGRVEGLIRAVALLYGGFQPQENDLQIGEGELYPRFVENEIRVQRRFGEGRWQAERVSYIAIGLSTIIAIILLWI